MHSPVHNDTMAASHTTPDPRPARIDPRPARSRELILDTAIDYFARHGYSATSVDDLAADAGVAKRTVYNLFGSKDELFRAVIRRTTEIAERFVDEQVRRPVGAAPLEEELRAFAVVHARAVLTPRVVAVRRLLIGEAVRFPDLAEDYFERVPRAVIRALAERLGRYGDAGLFSVPDAGTAAEHFAYLVFGARLDRALFEPGIASGEELESSARAGADAFLRAYRAA
jgi:TetR/AcrR family transcriptional regulator, mexJK operon transcriptional repressor